MSGPIVSIYRHAAVCLGYGEDNPQLLVIGGIKSGLVVRDMWLLDVQSLRWREAKPKSVSVSVPAVRMLDQGN